MEKENGDNEIFGPFKAAPIPGRKPSTPYSFTPEAVTEDMKSLVKRQEDRKYHLYRDRNENMTIGYGLMLPNLDSARELPLYSFSGKTPVRPVTREEIDDAWGKVKSVPGRNLRAENFDPVKNTDKNLPNIGLRDSDMEFLLEQRMRRGVDHLESQLPKLRTYPAGPRAALSDLEYNIGPTKFRREYINPDTGKNEGWPNLFKAVEDRDWARAAAESRRSTPNEQRNIDTRERFLDGLWQDERKTGR